MWILVEDKRGRFEGDLVFEGNLNHWRDCFFDNASQATIQAFCDHHGWEVTFTEDEMSDKTSNSELTGSEAAVEATPAETPKHPITVADPEGDGLTSGQATADTVGDILGI